MVNYAHTYTGDYIARLILRSLKSPHTLYLISEKKVEISIISSVQKTETVVVYKDYLSKIFGDIKVMLLIIPNQVSSHMHIMYTSMNKPINNGNQENVKNEKLKETIKERIIKLITKFISIVKEFFNIIYSNFLLKSKDIMPNSKENSIKSKDIVPNSIENPSFPTLILPFHLSENIGSYSIALLNNFEIFSNSCSTYVRTKALGFEIFIISSLVIVSQYVSNSTIFIENNIQCIGKNTSIIIQEFLNISGLKSVLKTHNPWDLYFKTFQIYGVIFIISIFYIHIWINKGSQRKICIPLLPKISKKFPLKSMYDRN